MRRESRDASPRCKWSMSATEGRYRPDAAPMYAVTPNEGFTLEYWSSRLRSSQLVLSPGCPACVDLINIVNEIACPSFEVSILDMNDASVAARAKGLGTKQVPAVVVNGHAR